MSSTGDPDHLNEFASGRATSNPPDFDFVISNVEPDTDWAKWIGWQVEAGILIDGRPARAFVQAWDAVPGANTPVAKHLALSRSTTKVILVISDAYLDGVGQPQAEWSSVWPEDQSSADRAILPVRITSRPAPGLLRPIKSIDLAGYDEARAEAHLRDGILASLAGRAKPGVAPNFPTSAAHAVRDGRPSGKPPFPGPGRSADVSTTAPAPWAVPDKRGATGPIPHRARLWLVGAILVGLAAGTGILIDLTRHRSGEPTSPGSSATAQVPGTLPAQPGSGAQAAANSEISSLQIQASTGGFGCPPLVGMVFPRALTPELNTSVPPGTGPKRGGATWDQDPEAFGAVLASPVDLRLNLTGPTSHAVTITGLQLHVLSRKPQVDGYWLNTLGQCGGNGTYHRATFDLDAPAPYRLPASALRPDLRADEVQFPYFTSALNLDDFDITVQSEHCDCTWDATLTWVDGASAHSKTIDDDGHPFESTSVTGLTRTDWAPLGDSTWTRKPS